jgi:hypothetical protein
VRYINDRYRRTGTQWERRYKAYLVDSDRHLLRYCRHIDLNPAWARMIADAGDYAWSSEARLVRLAGPAKKKAKKIRKRNLTPVLSFDF